MNWDAIDILRAIIVFVIIAGISVGLFFLCMYFINIKNNVLVIEGYVEALIIERSYGSTYYYAVIDGKYYKILASAYDLLKVGDLVRIYESGRCVIL